MSFFSNHVFHDRLLSGLPKSSMVMVKIIIMGNANINPNTAPPTRQV